MRGIFMIATIYSTFSGKLAGKHPTLGVWVQEDGMVLRPKHGGSKTFIWKRGCTGARGGYLRVVINGKNYFVHRLVAETFIPNPEGKPFVDHINRNRTDNRRQNLRFVTASENQRNTEKYDNAFDYGVRECDDRLEYERRYSLAKYNSKRSDPEWYKEFLRRCRESKEKRRRKEGKPIRKKAEREARSSG